MLSATVVLVLCQAWNAVPDATALSKALFAEVGAPGAVTLADAAIVDEFEYVTVNVPYLDVRGREKMGQARMVARTADLEAKTPLPLFCHIHYEKDVQGATRWCRRGWAVVTPHYGDPAQGGYALELAPGDSFNLAKAIIQWARRQPFVDRSRLHLDGGSAGGYGALAMGAEFFPVTSITADAPVLNWPYNLNYFELNKPVSRYGATDADGKPVNPMTTATPFLSAVAMLTDWAYGVFGTDLASDTYWRLSPMSYLDRITCPTLILMATGDMLVPGEQYVTDHLTPHDPAAFPEGYVRSMAEVAPSDRSRRTLAEALGDSVEIFIIERADDVQEVTLPMVRGEEKQPKGPADIARPWSRDKQWSLVILDEGAPVPHASHTRYRWSTSPVDFVEAHRTAVPDPAILTPAKLDALLRRYTGEETELLTLADGTRANRRNFDALERIDVLTGLLDYAAYGAGHAARLRDLYAAGAMKPFGETLDLEALHAQRDSGAAPRE